MKTAGNIRRPNDIKHSVIISHLPRAIPFSHVCIQIELAHFVLSPLSLFLVV
jgi:hypothetical protein